VVDFTCVRVTTVMSKRGFVGSHCGGCVGPSTESLGQAARLCPLGALGRGRAVALARASSVRDRFLQDLPYLGPT